MAITSVGYDGSINESQWARLVPLVGASHYGVAGTNDWKVTSHPTMDRGVRIATGTGWGHGVMDTNDATVSLQGATVGSGSRWDMVVARRNWSGVGGNTTFVIIGGSSSKALPSRNTSPGTLDDQPIALVQFSAGQTSPTSIVDLRCWGRNGGMAARDDLALSYLAEMASQVKIDKTLWTRSPDQNGNPVWTSAAPDGTIPLFGVGGTLAGSNPPAGSLLIQAGSQVAVSDAFGYARVVWPKQFPNGLLYCSAVNGDEYAVPNMFPCSAGHNWGSEGFGNTKSWVYACRTAASTAAANKQHRINWLAIGW